MIDSLQNQDPELDLLTLNKKDIIDSITLSDVKYFLESLGVEHIIINEEKQQLICPTICHHPLHEASSLKLYWYQNYKLFHCYTECNENMSIFKLYQKFIEINDDRLISDSEAEEYVISCLKHIVVSNHNEQAHYNWSLEKYNFTKAIPQLPEYNKAVLDYFTNYYHPLWLKDGITKAAMDKFQIKFSLGQNKIVIPHFDINGRLIGIRARTLDQKEIDEFGGKYRPIQIGDTIYAHPLQFNLYGIYEHQEGIRKRRCAIIAEGEKSVLLDEGFYGKYSNTVACCGSTFNKYHISLLTDILGANEIVIALDKEYEDWRDSKAKKYREKIEGLCRRYINQANFSYIWDYNNLLQEKDSPFDRGKKEFEQLFKERVNVK